MNLDFLRSIKFCLKSGIFSLSLLGMVEMAWAKKQVLTLNEDETLIVKVSQEGPIRISVKGDRLQDVMGLDESINVEKDETHGLLYLRNVDKKQSLTFITEGGVFQDITLIPEAHGVSVIVMKSKDYEEDPALKKSLSSFRQFASSAMNVQPPLSFQEQVLVLIKQLYQGRGALEEQEAIPERFTTYNVVAKPLRSLQMEGMRGEVYEVVNTTDTTLNLVEKDFYRIGDYALSIGKNS